jgi:hypothetical protein
MFHLRSVVYILVRKHPPPLTIKKLYFSPSLFLPLSITSPYFLFLYLAIGKCLSPQGGTVFSNIYRTSLLALLLEQTKIVLVRKFLDVDVLKAILAMRRDDGIAESQPTAENFRFFLN